MEITGRNQGSADEIGLKFHLRIRQAQLRDGDEGGGRRRRLKVKLKLKLSRLFSFQPA